MMNIDLLLLLFFLLGMSTMGLVMLLFKMKHKYTFRLPARILISLGLMLLIFSVAWSVSSLIEFENQAAGIGLLFFGGSALLCFSAAVRFISKK